MNLFFKWIRVFVINKLGEFSNSRTNKIKSEINSKNQKNYLFVWCAWSTTRICIIILAFGFIWFQNLERTHKIFVNGHHSSFIYQNHKKKTKSINKNHFKSQNITSIIKFSTIIRSWKQCHQLSFGKKLVPIFYNLGLT